MKQNTTAWSCLLVQLTVRGLKSLLCKEGHLVVLQAVPFCIFFVWMQIRYVGAPSMLPPGPRALPAARTSGRPSCHIANGTTPVAKMAT
jgi:hypothetical protein